MKRFILIPAAMLALASCGNNTELTISGKTDSDTQNVYILAGNDTLAVAPVVDGAFKVTVPAEEPSFLYVREENGSTGAVLAEPGKVSYEMTDRHFKATGTPLNDKYDAYRTKSSELYDEYQKTEDKAEKEAISKKYDDLDASFFEDNVSNWLGVYALTQNQYSMGPAELEEALAKLSPEFAENKDVVRLQERLVMLKKTAIGQPCIEIKLPSPEGNEISLSETVAANKYVLLDFWASWCGPCMGEVPYLVKDYAEYHSKGFEIFGVSLDRTKEPWVKAIADNKMSWLHVSDIKYWDCAPAKEYGVNSIPANYLIDSNGIIVARNLRGEALGEKLAELLGE